MISDRLLWILIAGFVVVKLALVGWWPFLALERMPDDVALFLSQAMSILEGDWLGPYTERTLMKGPITPMWIALMNFLGIPLLLSHHVFYIAACILCMLTLKRFTQNNWYLLFVFLLLLLNPFSYNYGPIAAAFREMLQQPVVLTAIALSIILVVDFIERRTVNIGLSVLFGIVLFMFWNNREEGVWMVPYLLWLLFIIVFYTWKDRGQNNRQAITKMMQVVLIPCAIWWLGTLALAWKNYQEYEVFAVVELKTPQFKRAFGGLLGIKADRWRSKFAAPPDVLDKLYSLPSGSELDLDQKANAVRKPIMSMILPWNFRWAVADAGYYKKGGAAVLEFYDRLGTEIEQACAEQKFACSKPLFDVFPPWHPGYTRGYLGNISRIFEQVLSIKRHIIIDDYYSFGTPEYILAVSRLVNSPIRVDERNERRLPSFYKRLKKNKTRIQEDLVEFYRFVVPYLFWLAMLGIFSRTFFIIKERQAALLDTIYIGLAVTVLLQLMMLAVLRITGYSYATRLFFMLYPVFYTFIAIGLLSLIRDVRRAVALFRS